MTSMPLNSVVASVTKVEDKQTSTGYLRLRVKGYALPALGTPVDEVQISVDDATHKVDEHGYVPQGEEVIGDLAKKGNVIQQPLPEGLDVDAQHVWEDATIIYSGGRWGWTLWEGEVVAAARKGKIIVRSRARSHTGETQPPDGKWNMRGVAWNGWSIGEYEVAP